MAVLLKYERKPVAYVEGTTRIIIRKDIAVLIYRCLSTYNLNVEPGVEDSIITPFGRVDGIKVSVLRMDATEDYVIQAIRICFGYKTGVRLELEKIDKIVELSVKNKEGSEDEVQNKQNDLQFEKS